MPLLPSPPRFPKCHVQFTELTFDTEATTNIAYKQTCVNVVINSQQENARVKDIKPKRTRYSDRDEKELLSTKIGQTRGITAGFTLGLQPQGTITGTAAKTIEATTSSEKKRYNSGITERHRDGFILWAFNVDNVNFQEWGIDMQGDVLPAVCFDFVGDSDVPAPPLKCMDIVITSYWSMILPNKPKSTWIHKFLHLFKSSGNTQTTSYLNLFQVVALKTVPSNLPKLSRYKAEVKVRS